MVGDARGTIGVLYEQGGCSLVLGTVDASDVLAHGRRPPPPPAPPAPPVEPVIRPGSQHVSVRLALPTQLGNTTSGPPCFLAPLLMHHGTGRIALQRATSLGAPHTAEW
jgi:hypothetical protein